MLIQTQNNLYDIPLRLSEGKYWSYENKTLFNWILGWYLDKHLELASMESLSHKKIENYIFRSEKMIELLTNNLQLETVQHDTLDKEIYNKMKNI